MQRQESITRSLTPEFSRKSSLAIEAFLRRWVGNLECGELVIETPAGEQILFSGRQSGPQAVVAVHSWRCLWRLIASGELGIAEAYSAGEWSSPNLVSLLKLACGNAEMLAPPKFLRVSQCWSSLCHAMNRNTRRGSRRNIAAHYDLGNEFYQQWLDPGMTYSAGLFSSTGQTLEQAQDAKLDHVIGLMELAGEERVLEIGCGWGSLAERIMERHDCTLKGITLSAQQLAFAKRRISKYASEARCNLHLQDYRDVRGKFDRIVSIEMLEAVGKAYWPTYFKKLHDCLRPGGIAVLQVITIDEARFENYCRNTDFIQKYIFPGGMLPTSSIIEREASRAGFRIVSKDFFGSSYARTLEEWQLRFMKSWPAIKALGFDERFKRIWEYYLAYCQAGFEAGAINVGLYKIVHSVSTKLYIKGGFKPLK